MVRGGVNLINWRLLHRPRGSSPHRQTPNTNPSASAIRIFFFRIVIGLKFLLDLWFFFGKITEKFSCQRRPAGECSFTSPDK